MLIPLVNRAVGIVVGIDIAKNFGKGVRFGLGFALVGFIFIPSWVLAARSIHPMRVLETRLTT